MFFDDNDLDSISDKVTCYINYCVEYVITCTQIKFFPNNKPWVTREVKVASNRKKLLFSSVTDQIKIAPKELKKLLNKVSFNIRERLKVRCQIVTHRVFGVV